MLPSCPRSLVSSINLAARAANFSSERIRPRSVVHVTSFQRALRASLKLGQLSRICATVCSPCWHWHNPSSTSWTFLLWRKHRSPMWPVRICVKTDENGLVSLAWSFIVLYVNLSTMQKKFNLEPPTTSSDPSAREPGF
jgi:hypothetical protein